MKQPLHDFAARRAQLTPQRVAFEDARTGESVSFGQFEQRVASAAGLLQAQGLEAGDRVAIVCRNRIEFFELLFACARAGAVAVPLNWRMPAAELATLVQDCRPGLVVTGAEDREAAAAAAPGQPIIDLDDAGPGGYISLRANAAALQAGRGRDADDLWYLLYTSGTTGQPKAVMQTFGMALANMVNISLGMGLRADDVSPCFLPLFHTGGINLLAVPFLMIGARTLMLPGFDADIVVDLLSRRRISVFFGVPAVYQALTLHSAFPDLDLTAVRSWACGGAPLPDVLVRKFAQAGARVCNGMGMTETGPTVFLMDEDEVMQRIGSVGKAQLLAQVRLVADGVDVAPGDTGELWFSGPGITPGYWNRPEATAEALTADGWLRSGDLGRCDEDGYYYVVGRLKDMFISGGENVYPAEVENVLAEHPDILEAAVVADPDERWGEVGRAYLLPRPDHVLPDADELTAFCRARLAAFKVPKRFVEVADFPRTAAGKIRKHLLEGDT